MYWTYKARWICRKLVQKTPENLDEEFRKMINMIDEIDIIMCDSKIDGGKK